jgi:hypothetical protein
MTHYKQLLEKWRHKELTLEDFEAYVDKEVTEQDNLNPDEQKEVAKTLQSIYLWDTRGVAIGEILVSLLKDKFSEFMTNARYIDRKASRIYHDFVWRVAPASVLNNAKQLR